jgi:hypothetical protein
VKGVHVRLPGAQTVTQLREGAQFVEAQVHSAGWKHMGRPRGFTKLVGNRSNN